METVRASLLLFKNVNLQGKTIRSICDSISHSGFRFKRS